MSATPPAVVSQLAHARASDALAMNGIDAALSLERVIAVDDMGELPHAFLFVFAIAGDTTRRVLIGPCGVRSDGAPVNIGSQEVSYADLSSQAVVDLTVASARYYAWYRAVGGDLNETLYGDAEEVMPRLEKLAQVRNVDLSHAQLDTIRRRLAELDQPLDYFATIFQRVLAASSGSELSLDP